MLLKRIIPAILWALLILVLCCIPGSQMPEVPFWDILAFDKFAHMSVFLIFTLLLKVGFLKQHQYAVLRYRVNVISISIAITYGILIEIIQGALLIDRFIELNDMIANAIGSVLGLLIFRLIYGNCINNK